MFSFWRGLDALAFGRRAPTYRRSTSGAACVKKGRIGVAREFQIDQNGLMVLA
ncbi:MAG: hypothetical protein U1F16_06685 [Turneriella sp.]